MVTIPIGEIQITGSAKPGSAFPVAMPPWKICPPLVRESDGDLSCLVLVERHTFPRAFPTVTHYFNIIDFWHPFWHYFCHSFWNSIQPSFWHSLQAFYLAPIPTFYLTCFFRTFPPGILYSIYSDILFDILSDILSGILSGFYWHSVWHSGPGVPHSIRSSPHGSERQGCRQAEQE